MKNSIGKRLKGWREKRGLSQDDVSRLLFCSVSTVQSIELERREPSGDMRDRIIRLLRKGE